MEVIKLLIEHPDAGVVILVVGICFAVLIGFGYATLLDIKKKLSNVMTEDSFRYQLSVSLIEFRKELEKTFVTQPLCEATHKNANAIPVGEHFNLMARVAALEKESEK